ncbi:DNA polymerase III subunit epsilon [Brevundimonas aveniformis]|uniref:DNA polymerase III subunit epsilon n=1 Tax=Brevundimonas aveniformis TaxID=370977 RepID=UPI00040133CC|nr:DNA polymerase III subunit epsilon [Brevundimonas aveniformis]
MREIVLDTETTGFNARGGDRMVEIGCIELENLTPTGRTFHKLINPERVIGPEVVRVHGITNEKVRDAPRFAEIADELLAFVGDAPVVAHNAGFDRSFVNFELETAGRAVIDDAQWVDTLQLAQKRFPGMSNSLDALCKRFKVSLTERTLHGALIDARLLASVYLELRGGRERVLDLSAPASGQVRETVGQSTYGERPRPLGPASTEDERARHAAFLRATLSDLSLWTRLEPGLAD